MLILNFSVGTTENGWTTDRICFEWFDHCFLPQAKARNTSGKPIALIMDNHGSHVTSELRRHAEDNGVHIYTFPAHTTHKLQPLDVGVFGPLQRAWQSRCVEVLQERNTEITQREFVVEYLAIRNKVFTPNLIQKAFKNTGIHPFNPNIFAAEDFAPSQVTSHKVHVPLSYPEPHIQDEGEAVSSDRGDGWGSDWGDSDDDDDEVEEPVDDDDGGEGMSVDDDGDAGKGDEGSQGGGVDSEVTVNESLVMSLDDSNAQDPEPLTEASNDAPSNPPPQMTGPTRTLPRPHGPSEIPASMEDLQARIRALEAENQSLHTHATMAYKEIDQLQHRINARKNKEKGKGRVSIATAGGGWWTIGEGRRRALEKDAQDDAKAKAKEQAAADKRVKADERQRQRAFLTAPFTGALASKTKEDLKDIAWALSLAVDSKATKSDFQRLINEHLDQFPALAEQDRFRGLYTSRSRTKRPARPPNNENLAPSSGHAQHFDGDLSSGSSLSFPPGPSVTPGPAAYHPGLSSAVPRSPTRSPLSFEYAMISPHVPFNATTPFATFSPAISLEEKTHLLFSAPIPPSTFYSHTRTHSQSYPYT